MINTETSNQEPVQDIEQQESSAPDEHGGIHVQGFLKISDPESGEIILQGRA